MASETFLAPPVTINALRDAAIAGCSLADSEGKLSKEGLCAFWTLVSLVVCTSLYYFGRFISPLIFRCYHGLSREDQREWDVRYSSMPHAILCVWYAYIMLWDSDFFYKDGPVPNITRTNDVTYTALGISLGFFIVDGIITYKYNMGGTEMLLHHIGSFTSVLTAILTGQGHMHTLWMLVTEFTTPFINMRWWLEKAGMKSSSLYFYNGMAIFISWIVARILIFPPFFYVVYQQRRHIALLSIFAKILLFVVPMILIMLNLFWFTKILRGVIKLLAPPKEKKTD